MIMHGVRFGRGKSGRSNLYPANDCGVPATAATWWRCLLEVRLERRHVGSVMTGNNLGGPGRGGLGQRQRKQRLVGEPQSHKRASRISEGIHQGKSGAVAVAVVAGEDVYEECGGIKIRGSRNGSSDWQRR